eukprot:760353-Hanusia_phi.AAC.1
MQVALPVAEGEDGKLLSLLQLLDHHSLPLRQQFFAAFHAFSFTGAIRTRDFDRFPAGLDKWFDRIVALHAVEEVLQPFAGREGSKVGCGRGSAMAEGFPDERSVVVELEEESGCRQGHVLLTSATLLDGARTRTPADCNRSTTPSTRAFGERTMAISALFV